MANKDKLLKPIKVAIVDDEKAYRILIKNIIKKDKRIKFFAEYSSAEDFIDSLKSPFNIPNVCIMDIQLKKMSGIECIKKIRKTYPDIHFIVMTAHPDSKAFAEIKEFGIDYIEKGTIIETLIDRIISIKATILETADESYILSIKKHGKINLKYMELIECIEKSKLNVSELSVTQIEVVKLKNKGKSSEESGKILGMSAGTVRTHLKRARRKLKLPDLLNYIFD